MDKIVTRDELWLEFKKAIDYGRFEGFKTKRGMSGHLNRLIRKHRGKSIKFIFSPYPHKYEEYTYKITKEDIEYLKLSK